MAIKSNPYVYPYTPFFDLSQKAFTSTFQARESVDLSAVERFWDILGQPTPDLAGKDEAEKILSVFQDEEFRFGPDEYIRDNYDQWKDRLNFFINRGIPIEFTILGFPFKIPVPLKTNRSLPDMGEVLSLKRLHTIAELVGQAYGAGCRITIFSEGIFAQSIGLDPEAASRYHEYLVKINDSLGFSGKLRILPLGGMRQAVDNFDELHKDKVNELKELYEKQDKAYLEKYKGTYESVYRIVSTTAYDEQVLMDVYNEDLADSEISGEVKAVRKGIAQRTHEAIFQYHAFLMVRDDIGFIENTVPNAVTLSVSPKPDRLGIIPVNKDCQRLPYHSVPVYHPGDKRFSLDYLIDIKRDGGNYKPVFLEEDEEDVQFYFIRL